MQPYNGSGTYLTRMMETLFTMCMKATTDTIKFQTGQTAACRSLGDHNCVWVFTVIKRTAKFVTLEDSNGETYRVGVYDWDGAEACKPFGRYSMAPTLRADREVW